MHVDCLSSQASNGILDGFTVFRFAHMFRNPSGGGMERYLCDLNRRLLDRNRMRILQMYLVNEDRSSDVTVERIGLGELVWIPSVLDGSSHVPQTLTQRLVGAVKRRVAPRPLVSHDVFFATINTFDVNLAVFHWISQDSARVLQHVTRSGIPSLVVNHFENTRFNRPLVRKQLSNARAVGGVSGVNVPTYLKDSFTNLSDGIDTDFYEAAKAVGPSQASDGPFILLPSRITEGKGHLDAVAACRILLAQGVASTLVFAGRVDSDHLLTEIKAAIHNAGLTHRVVFTGELTAEELRNWYGGCTLVVFPTCTEGLGRVLLEAQAMNKPVVAYNVGGVPEAVIHGDTGYLVRKGNIAELAQRLQLLLSDDELRQRMGTRGRSHVVKRFSLDGLVLRHEVLYKRVCGSPA